MIPGNIGGAPAAALPPNIQQLIAASLAANPQAGLGNGPDPGFASIPSVFPSQPSSPAGPSGGSGIPNPITSDPGYMQALAASQAGDASAAAQRDSLINQALIGFGGSSDFASAARSMGMSQAQIDQIMGAINPNTEALASGNTNSTLSRLSQAHDQALSQLRASLAARGALESGSTGVGAGLEGTHYQQGISDAYQALMGALGGYQSDYAKAVNQDAGNLASAAGSAFDRQQQLIMAGMGSDPGPGAAPAAPLPPAGARAPVGLGPAGSTVASSASPGTYNVGGVQISPGRQAAAAVARVKKQALVNPYTTGQKRFG